MRFWPLFVIAVLCCSAQARADAPLRVHARTQFSGLQVQREPNRTRVTGALRDEGDSPVVDQIVALASATGSARDCDGRAMVTTSSTGAFCFALGANARGNARLSFEGNDYLHAAARDLSLDEQPAVELQLSTPTTTWALTEPTHPIHVEVHTGSGDRHRISLRVVRSGAPDRALDAVVLGPDLSADVEVPSSALGGPGTVELVAVAGDDLRHPVATKSIGLLLTAPVELQWVAPPPAVRPELGFELQIRATALGQPVESGWIETRARTKVLGSAPVAGGLATVSNRFLAAGHGTIPFSARYVSEHPWLLGGSALEVDLVVSRPSAWIHLPWLLIGLGAAVWIFRAWWRPVRRNFASQPTVNTAAPSPGIIALDSGARDGRFHGSVRDAHTGDPIAGAWLRVLLPSVGIESVVTEVQADPGGQFNLGPLPNLPEGARFEITAQHHSRLRLAPPGPGQVEIRLMSRRRSLLQRLTEWVQARRWPDAASLTPGDVATRAQRMSEAEVERWALDIQDAVFGNGPIDEQRERALGGRTPALTPQAPVKR